MNTISKIFSISEHYGNTNETTLVINQKEFFFIRILFLIQEWCYKYLKLTKEMEDSKDKYHPIDFSFCFNCYRFIDISDSGIGDNNKSKFHDISLVTAYLNINSLKV
jgi:hypothetical protein